MSYQALYRVWRPQKFEDVVGQEHIVQTLQNAIVQQKISHAYLFSGPRGTGKTSAAKIFAKAINCEHAPTKEPCNQCKACIGITNGTIDDVLEMDAASNNGVDEIREIREKVKYAPSYVKYKVYIIDEVHMLSIGAFNALLKTLEEPPPHVIFILATTEPHKIPLTIISRCQRYEFHKIRPSSIIGRLQYVAEQQSVNVEQDALQVVARAAEGGMRDALSILDQAISYADEIVTVDDVLSVTGAVSQEYLLEIIRSIHEGETIQSLELVNKLYNLGKDPHRLIEDVMYFYRDLLLFQTSPQLEHLFEKIILNDEVKLLANEISSDDIRNSISVLAKVQQEMKYTTHPKILLEAAMIQLVQQRVSNTKAISTSEQVPNDLIKRIQDLEKRLQTTTASGATSDIQEKKSASPRASTSRNIFKPQITSIKKVLSEATKAELNKIKSGWSDIMEQIRHQNKAFAALLAYSEPVAASNTGYVISFKYEILCQKADANQELMNSLHQFSAEVIGKSLELYFIPEEQWLQLRQDFLSREKESVSSKEEDSIIAEAIKLVGEDLIKIIE